MKTWSSFHLRRLMQVFVDAGILASLLLVAVSGYATTLYWDANGTTAGFGTDLTGDWNTNAFWSTSSDGTATSTVWPGTATNDVIFSAVDCTADSAVTVQNVFGSSAVNSVTTKAAAKSVKIQGTTTGRVLTMTNAASFNVENGAAVYDLDLAVVVAGSAGLNKTGTGTMRLSNTNNYYTGTTHIQQGTVYFGNNVIPDSSALIIDSSATLRADGGGRQETVGSIAGAGNLILKSATANAQAFTAGGDNSSTEYSGPIKSDNATGWFVKTGSGTLTLSGANTFGQETQVTNGVLIVNGTHTGGSNYTVYAGATLGGTGTVTLASASSVKLNGSDAANRAKLAPGVAGVGTLTVANGAGGTNIVFGAYSELKIALTGDTVPKLACGAMDLGGATDYLTINVTGTRTRSRYVFATYTGSLADNIFDHVTVTGVSNSQIDYSVPGEIAVILTCGTMISVF